MEKYAFTYVHMYVGKQYMQADTNVRMHPKRINLALYYGNTMFSNHTAAIISY